MTIAADIMSISADAPHCRLPRDLRRPPAPPATVRPTTRSPGCSPSSSTGSSSGSTTSATLTEALDHPQRAFAPILVAGTNGKGSVAAMLERGTASGGVPHRTLHLAPPRAPRRAHRRRRAPRSSERALADARGEALRTVVDRLQAARAASRPRRPSSRRRRPSRWPTSGPPGVRVAVLEVGMGGRFDATNVDAPRGGGDSRPSISTTSASWDRRWRRSRSRRRG